MMDRAMRNTFLPGSSSSSIVRCGWFGFIIMPAIVWYSPVHTLVVVVMIVMMRTHTATHKTFTCLRATAHTHAYRRISSPAFKYIDREASLFQNEQS